MLSTRDDANQRSRASSRVVADVWEKDVWEFQAKPGSSGSCRLFLHFQGKIAVQEMSGKTSGSPRHSSSRHPWPPEAVCSAKADAGPVSSKAAPSLIFMGSSSGQEAGEAIAIQPISSQPARNQLRKQHRTQLASTLF